MMIKGNDVIGLKVISIDRGQRIEDVDDLIYDPSEQRIKALLVDKGGFMSGAKIIPFEEI